MAGLPKALFWQRTDAAGSEHVVLSDRAGLHARGVMAAATPVPFALRYELYTDDQWVTARFEATAEGAGFVRSVRLERAAGRWRVTATEQGDLDAALMAAGHPRAGMPGAEDPGRLHAALDVDLGFSPLTNTLPVRRLGLLGSADTTADDQPAQEHTVAVAWVLVPSLEVVASEQTYRALGGERVRFRSGSFAADLTLDASGYVLAYPGLAVRV
jgi:hypothetical protein